MHSTKHTNNLWQESIRTRGSQIYRQINNINSEEKYIENNEIQGLKNPKLERESKDKNKAKAEKRTTKKEEMKIFKNSLSQKPKSDFDIAFEKFEEELAKKKEFDNSIHIRYENNGRVR